MWDLGIQNAALFIPDLELQHSILRSSQNEAVLFFKIEEIERVRRSLNRK